MEEDNHDVMGGVFPTYNWENYNSGFANLNYSLIEAVIKLICPTNIIFFKLCDHFRIQYHVQDFMGKSKLLHRKIVTVFLFVFLQLQKLGDHGKVTSVNLQESHGKSKWKLWFSAKNIMYEGSIP
jgi:hypothetical protein